VLADTQLRATRARMLPAAVEILLAAGDVDAARAAAAELADIAATVGTPFLAAASAHARGAVLVADGEFDAASISLRRACEIWRDLGIPLEEAQGCRLMAVICEHRGDLDGHRLELAAARTLLHQLTATSVPVRAKDDAESAVPPSAGRLSDREIQVLRLLAAGKTNRGIAEALFISEKTVARHVSNIFDKVGVSSRTGAAAWAFTHHLV
jgi:DNA-binding CsgD family transcriptional regulator